MKKIDVSGIRVRAVEVAALHTARENAIEEEREAATKLLASLIEAVKPALPALSNKLPPTKTDFFTSDDMMHEMYGLRLDGNEQPKPPTPGRLPQPWSPRAALYVLHSGQLVTLSWASQGASADVDCVTADWAVGDWGAKVDQCARALSDALDAQLNGRSEKLTAAAIRQAARMRALATLLENRAPCAAQGTVPMGMGGGVALPVRKHCDKPLGHEGSHSFEGVAFMTAD